MVYFFIILHTCIFLLIKQIINFLCIPYFPPHFSLIEGEYIPSEEFPEGGPAAIRDLETAPFLRIEDDEAETWQQTVPPAELRQVWPITQFF